MAVEQVVQDERGAHALDSNNVALMRRRLQAPLGGQNNQFVSESKVCQHWIELGACAGAA